MEFIDFSWLDPAYLYAAAGATVLVCGLVGWASWATKDLKKW